MKSKYLLPAALVIQTLVIVTLVLVIVFYPDKKDEDSKKDNVEQSSSVGSNSNSQNSGASSSSVSSNATNSSRIWKSQLHNITLDYTEFAISDVKTAVQDFNCGDYKDNETTTFDFQNDYDVKMTIHPCGLGMGATKSISLENIQTKDGSKASVGISEILTQNPDSNAADDLIGSGKYSIAGSVKFTNAEGKEETIILSSSTSQEFDSLEKANEMMKNIKLIIENIQVNEN